MTDASPSSKAQRTVWVHVPAPTLTEKALQNAIRCHRMRQTHPVVDFDGKSIEAATGHPQPSAGRVVKLKRHPSAGGFLAQVRLSQFGYDQVSAGFRRYVTANVEPDSVDEVSGERIGPRLFSCSLRRDPATANHKPIRLPVTASQRRAAARRATDRAVALSRPHKPTAEEIALAREAEAHQLSRTGGRVICTRRTFRGE